MPVKLFGPYNIFDGQAVSSTTAYRSSNIDMLCMNTASLEIQWTGTAVGTFSLDGSNNGSTWYPTGTSIHNPTGAGSTDDTLVDVERVGFRYLSLSYTNASGSGTLTVTATAKGIGG